MLLHGHLSDLSQRVPKGTSKALFGALSGPGLWALLWMAARIASTSFLPGFVSNFASFSDTPVSRRAMLTDFGNKVFVHNFRAP